MPEPIPLSSASPAAAAPASAAAGSAPLAMPATSAPLATSAAAAGDRPTAGAPAWPEPSAVVWRWRGEAAAEDARHQAAAARRRGLIGGVVGLLAAAGVAFGLHRPVLGAVAAVVAATIAGTALASPLKVHRRLMRAFDLLAHGVGTAVTWALMVLLYYLLFLPAGLLLRAGGKIAVTRRPEPALGSYWNPTAAAGAQAAESYRKQF